MRLSFLSSVLVVILLAPGCKKEDGSGSSEPAPVSETKTVKKVADLELKTVKAGCASCIFDMKEAEGCMLAVSIDDKPYLVKGSKIDEHGDAHGPNGLCSKASDAVVTGRIEGDWFVADSFELVPSE